MSVDAAVDSAGVPWARNWRIAIPVGVLAILASFAVVVAAPIVFPSVLAWWLHIDLTEHAERGDGDRPGWLGIMALVAFAIAAAIVVVVVVSLDSHFDCGGTLGGFGESASARLDEACVSERAWRPVVGAVSMLALPAIAGFRIRRSSTATPGDGVAANWGVPRAVTTMAGMTVLMVLVITALVLS